MGGKPLRGARCRRSSTIPTAPRRRSGLTPLRLKRTGSSSSPVGLGYADIAKTTIFVTDMGDFATVNAVYSEFVGDSKPARSTVGVAALPLGVPVEIEVIAAR